STTLNAYGAANYEWLPAAYCETPNNATTVVYPRSNQQFLVLGTDANGCVAKDSILIINDGASVVTFPNVFTPNNDGINDYFKVLYTCNFNFKELKIFNRWGQEVFVSGDQNKGWDGNSKGKESELVVYYYLLKGTNDNGKEVLLKGDISLLR
ncbi:MAG: gliding motility-associated C-terminal domain-containing protein, partial [Chitinophagaceae bacterium]|nr:gliding motility-associated C-terminal domain-containing protein [Chitinophagaceae bacterium]